MVNLSPLPNAEIGQELALAELTQLILTQRLPLLFNVLPQIYPRDEVRFGVIEPRVLLIGFARVFS